MENIKKFLPYLDELRKKLYSSAIIFAVVFVIGFFLSAPAIKFFVKSFYIDGVVISTTSPFQITDLAVSFAIFLALIITIPILIFEIYTFVFPGLSKKERRMMIVSIPTSIFLFAIGFALGFFILFFSFKLLAVLNSSLGIKNIWSINSYLLEIFITSSLLGLIFQFPLILTGLVRLGVVGIQSLKEKRRIVWLGTCILVSILPPTDGLSLIAMSAPLVILYEITILINRKVGKGALLIKNDGLEL